MKNARDFASKIKLVLSELDDKLIDAIIKEVKSLSSEAVGH